MRHDSSLANFKDQLIFITGGRIHGESVASNEVFYYEIKADRWFGAPLMTKDRCEHGSCILGD